jgi:hypothetical protein
MKSLLYISIAIIGLIFIKEIGWLGKTDLAPVILGICIAIGLQGIYLIKNSKD